MQRKNNTPQKNKSVMITRVNPASHRVLIDREYLKHIYVFNISKNQGKIRDRKKRKNQGQKKKGI